MAKLKEWVDCSLAHGYTTPTAELDTKFSSLPSFGKMLPYRDYHPEFGLFELGEPGEEGRYCGVMYEYASFVHDANSLEAQRYRISYEIEQALLNMPEGYAWQFMVDSDRNVSKYLPPPPPPANDGAEEDMMRELQREQISFLHDAAKSGLWGKGHMYPKTMRFRCFIWRPPQKPTYGQRTIGWIEREPVQTESTDIKEQMISFNQKIGQFESQMKNSQIMLMRRNATHLIEMFFQLFHKRKFHQGLFPPEWIPGEDLGTQLFQVFPVTDDKFVFSDGHYYRSTAATESPAFTDPCCLYYLLETPGDIHICLTGYSPPQSAERQALTVKGFMANMGLMNPMGDVNTGNKAILRDVKALEQKLIDGGKIFHSSLYVTAIASNYKAADETVKIAEAKLAPIKAKMLADNILSQSLMANSLPFHYAPMDITKNHLYRQFRLPSEYFADLVPVTGAWLGTKTPAIIGLSRTCEPVYLDMFDCRAPHFLISGTTGTGKSGLVNLMLIWFSMMGRQMYIIDPMGGFKKIAALLGPEWVEYVSFDLNAPVPDNPFDGEFDKERLSMLSGFVSSLMTQKDEMLSQHDISTIDRAIESTYEAASKYKDRGVSADLSMFYNTLRQHYGEKGVELSERLAFYVGRGKYARFFGKTGYTLEKPITIFDTSGLKDVPDLRRVQTMKLMLRLGHHVRTRPGEKVLFIEEAPLQFAEPSMAAMVEAALRTFRHYGTAVGLLMQQVSDPLKVPEVGRVYLSQAYTQIYFNQPAQAVIDAAAYLEVTAADAAVISGLQTKYGFYAESFVHCKALRAGGAGKGTVRFMSTPKMYAGLTSDPADKDKLKILWDEICLNLPDLDNNSKKTRELILNFAARYPHGITGMAMDPMSAW